MRGLTVGLLARRKSMGPSIFSPPAASRAIGEKLIVRMRAEWRGAAARVSAASALLDRGWGKPQQTHTGEDGANCKPQARRAALAAAMRPRYVRASAVRLHVEGQERDHVTPTLLPAGAIEALALCDAPLPVRLSLPPCSSHARGEPVATVRALPACAARCFCRHAADSAHSPWPEPCTFLRLCVALLRSEGMHRRLQDPVSMREEGVHRTF
jgi:hypothetical protein